MNKRMLKISSNPNNILEVENYLQNLKIEYNIDDNRYPDILISLTEAVNNAIIHGNALDESKCVHINTNESDGGIAISISDEGKGFNPDCIDDPTCPEKLECCGGRGVFIMSKLADQLTFLNGGSTVKMVFKLS